MFFTDFSSTTVLFCSFTASDVLFFMKVALNTGTLPLDFLGFEVRLAAVEFAEEIASI